MPHRRSGLARPALLAIALGLCACSAIVDTTIIQCKSDDDCVRFANSLCDRDTGLCTKRPMLNSDAGANATDDGATVGAQLCVGQDQCYACAPASDPQFLNACTDSACVPFDNRARLHNLTTGGQLRPLP